MMHEREKFLKLMASMKAKLEKINWNNASMRSNEIDISRTHLDEAFKLIKPYYEGKKNG